MIRTTTGNHYDMHHAVDTPIGWVRGQPLTRAALDERFAALRSGPHADLLPRPGSPQEHQLARWLAHVLVTELLCEQETADRGRVGKPGGALTALEATELGSIVAAAYTANAAVRAVYPTITAPRTLAAASTPQATVTRYRLRHGLYNDQASAAADADEHLASMGEATVADLPQALADAVRGAPVGQRIGPVRSGLGWHVAVIDAVVTGRDPLPDTGSDLHQPRAFRRWLDRAHARHVRMAKGFEHPGDPGQPDNSHRH
jgi:[acyl-carrier-protein] S-malonyltransferase